MRKAERLIDERVQGIICVMQVASDESQHRGNGIVLPAWPMGYVACRSGQERLHFGRQFAWTKVTKDVLQAHAEVGAAFNSDIEQQLRLYHLIGPHRINRAPVKARPPHFGSEFRGSDRHEASAAASTAGNSSLNLPLVGCSRTSNLVLSTSPADCFKRRKSS